MRTFRLLVVLACLLLGSVGVVSPCAAADDPISEEDIVSLIDLQIKDQVIITRIREAGLAFTADEQALKRLANKGASEELVKAVREAGTKRPADNPPTAITYANVLKLLKLKVPEDEIRRSLAKSPTVFTLSAEQVAELKKAGATETLLKALSTPRETSAAAAELITNIALVLDCSGSMREATKEGEAKMQAAKRVVAELIQKIPNGLNVTFVIYGHEVFGGANDPRNCQAVKIARPLGPLDDAGKAALTKLVAGLKPTGGTPIALSLKVTGEELAKNAGEFSGIVLISDGLESCKGDPAGEAAALLSKLKLSFGVNVVGLGVKDEEDAALKEIADAGKGKYFNADSAKELTEALAQVSEDLEKAAAPPKKVTSGLRAIKVLKPMIEFPEYKEIQVVSRGLGSISIDAQGKYGEEIRIPSGTKKYEIRWVPKSGEPVVMLKDFTLSERKVVEIKPEEHLGMIKVNGEGKPKKEIKVYQRGLGSILVLQKSNKFGEIMVVPAEKVNVSVDDEDIEEDLEVEAGTLHELE